MDFWAHSFDWLPFATEGTVSGLSLGRCANFGTYSSMHVRAGPTQQNGTGGCQVLVLPALHCTALQTLKVNTTGPGRRS